MDAGQLNPHMQRVSNKKNVYEHASNLHQRYPSEQGSVTSYNYSSSTPGTNKLIPHNAEIYETIILDP